VSSDPRALLGQTEVVAGFVAQMLRVEYFGNCSAIGFLDREGRLDAGVVYHDWNPEGGVIEISAAGVHPRWCTRGRLRMILGYPFDQLGCQMVMARTSEKNVVSLGICRRLGAETHRIPRLYGRDVAGFIMTITDDQWRGGKYGQE
jgi:RimJ/RimL family protein N-acetyltransferase